MGLFGRKVLDQEFINKHKVPTDMEYLLCVGSIIWETDSLVNNAYVLADGRNAKGAKYLLPMWGITGHDSTIHVIRNLGKKATSHVFSTAQLTAPTAHAVKAFNKAINKLENTNISVTPEHIESITNVSGYYLDYAGALVRNAMAMNYISQDEAFMLLKELYQITQEQYDNWIDYAIGTCKGREQIYEVFNNSYVNSFVRLYGKNDFYFTKYPLK